MNRIDSLKDLNALVNEIRLLRKGYISNLFINPLKNSLWIKKRELFYISFTEGFFVIRKSQLVNCLFYITTDTEHLRRGLADYYHLLNFTIMVDLVGDAKIVSIKQIFLDSGFRQYEFIYRMSRVGIPNLSSFDSGVSYAELNDTNIIRQLLLSNFNPLSEQIPEVEEIVQFIKNKRILVYKQGNEICGFIIFELTGLTLYLRYWFVCSQYRDFHIGSKLFNAFMYEGRNTKRQLFWVIADNENAIKRYKHYGFEAENMFDYELMKSDMNTFIECKPSI